MSETLPPTPEAGHPAGPKLFSRGFWVALSVIVIVAVTVFVLPLAVTTVHDGPRPHDGIGQMGTALKIYALDHSGHLPPNLRVMIPEYLSEKNYADFRYEARKTGERLDWLYYPWENLDVLPPDTIVLASPVTLLNTSGVQLRIVSKADGSHDYIPEADFQRLIREQNPPAASPSPDR